MFFYGDLSPNRKLSMVSNVTFLMLVSVLNNALDNQGQTLFTILMHNGWPINWAILPKIEKRKETGHIDTSKKKIARKFNENWTKERKWLKYDNEKQLMYCILCTKFVTSGKHIGNYPISFIKGCANFKTSALNDHESSTLHTDAVAH